jgi:hypothetical protein
VLKDAVHLLTVSHDGQYIIAGDHGSNIVVWTTSDWKVIVLITKYVILVYIHFRVYAAGWEKLIFKNLMES